MPPYLLSCASSQQLCHYAEPQLQPLRLISHKVGQRNDDKFDGQPECSKNSGSSPRFIGFASVEAAFLFLLEGQVVFATALLPSLAFAAFPLRICLAEKGLVPRRLNRLLTKLLSELPCFGISLRVFLLHLLMRFRQTSLYHHPSGEPLCVFRPDKYVQGGTFFLFPPRESRLFRTGF